MPSPPRDYQSEGLPAVHPSPAPLFVQRALSQLECEEGSSGLGLGAGKAQDLLGPDFDPQAATRRAQ